MIKTLLKKQFAEMFRSYLYDAKKNKKRSTFSFVMYVVLFAFLMIVVLGGMFAALSIALCAPLKEGGMGWLYFAILGLLGVVFGAFGSVFNTFSGLYLAKDNDLLLSMPIPVTSIMTARLLGVYLMGLMYSAVVVLPAIVVYQVFYPNIMSLVFSLVWMALISVIVLKLSLALGYVAARISLKLKNKSFVTVLVSLVGIGVYYFFSFKAQSVISDLLVHAVLYGEKVKDAAYPVYLFGRAAEGDFRALGIVAVTVVVIFALLWRILAHSFIRIATTPATVGKTKYKERKVERQGVFEALLEKELKRFTSSSTYMLNCGLAVLLLPAFGIGILVKGDFAAGLITEIWGLRPALAPVLFCAAVCLVAGMNDMAAPSVSLEGKNLWLVQSLPIKPLRVLQAKLVLQLLLTGVPALFCSVCMLAVLKTSAPDSLMFIVTVLAHIILMTLIDLVFGLKMPNLTWSSEITPIKQSGAVTLAILLHFVCTFLPPVFYFLFAGDNTGAALFFALWSAVDLILCLFFYLWLVSRGARKFAEL